MAALFDLDAYRADAEAFIAAIEREYYLHLAGHKASLDIEPIYERHAGLFRRDAVERLRELQGSSVDPEDRRRLRYLLHFAVDGLLGEATRSESVELARLETELVVEGVGDRIPYRQVQIAQANEPDADRRARLGEARDELLSERLDPVYLTALQREHECCRELGWRSYAEAYAELRGIDLDGLAAQTSEFLALTDASYAGIVGPQLDRAGVPGPDELRRSDLPRFFRAADLDAAYPRGQLADSLARTLGGLEIDLHGQANVTLDTESRPTKSPRAFCSSPRVPDEIYLVVAPVGGRDDYAALFHEAGHAEHHAHTRAALPFEYRHLGDNSVTESFAFLLEHLTSDREWLLAVVGVGESAPVAGHEHAVRLLMLRRYAAKLAYELELHAEDPAWDELPERYRQLLEQATAARWPRASWLADVDGGFYAACYLRAWALEARWRLALRERFGERWFDSPAAGRWLRALWNEGQRLDADELLLKTLGERLGFAALAERFEAPTL